MATIIFEFVVIETFERLRAVGALLEVLDQALPDIEWREREGLKKTAPVQAVLDGD